MATVKAPFWKAGSKPGLALDTWVIEDEVLVAGALARYRTAKAVGVDSETTGLDPLMPPAKTRLIQLSDGRDVTIFDLWKLHPGAIGRIVAFLEDPKRVKVLQNGKFDLKFFILLLGMNYMWPLFDTQIVSQLLDLGDKFGKHDYASLVQQFLGLRVDKDVSHSWSGELSDRQLVYASNDAAHLVPLRAAMVPIIRERGLVKATELELRCVQPTAQQELNGFLTNQKKWMRLYRENKVKLFDVEEKLVQVLKPIAGDNMALFAGAPTPFNLNSPEEIKARLKAMGVKLPTIVKEVLTEGKTRGNKTQRETILLDKMVQIADSHPAIGLLVERARLSRAVVSYGKKFLRWVNPHDGRVHPDVRQIGTITTRNSVKEPPMHGIPKQSDHRECFVAREGWELSWADYSQIELRILAEFSEDREMLRAFNEGRDLHKHTASVVFGVDYDSVVTVQRRRAKDLNFGIPYGVGHARFAERANIPVGEAEKIMTDHCRKHPRQTEYLNEAATHARVYGFCTTMSGKIITFKFDRNDRGQVAAVGRHGKNYPIQGSSADITKTAIRRVDARLRELWPGIPPAKWEIQLVHTIHDEIVLEHMAKHRELAREILHTEMKAAGEEFLKVVPVVVEVETNTFWAKAKDD